MSFQPGDEEAPTEHAEQHVVEHEVEAPTPNVVDAEAEVAAEVVVAEVAEAATEGSAEIATSIEQTEATEEGSVIDDAPTIAITVPEPQGDDVEITPDVSTVALDAAERPKSPWTPSYSVIMQGPGVGAPEAEDSEEIAELEQLPPSADETAVESVVITVEVPEIHTEAVAEEPATTLSEIIAEACD